MVARWGWRKGRRHSQQATTCRSLTGQSTIDRTSTPAQAGSCKATGHDSIVAGYGNPRHGQEWCGDCQYYKPRRVAKRRERTDDCGY